MISVFLDCSIAMVKKGGVTKHSAKELQAKIDAHKSRGGGEEGKDKRAPKCALICRICKASVASIKQMGDHYESKHRAVAFNAAEYQLTSS